MEHWYAQTHCMCVTGQKCLQKKSMEFHNHIDCKNIFSPMIVYPTYHLIWLLLVTAGSLKGKRITVSIHINVDTGYVTDKPGAWLFKRKSYPASWAEKR